MAMILIDNYTMKVIMHSTVLVLHVFLLEFNTKKKPLKSDETAPAEGLEPSTTGLKGQRSTD